MTKKHESTFECSLCTQSKQRSELAPGMTIREPVELVDRICRQMH